MQPRWPACGTKRTAFSLFHGELSDVGGLRCARLVRLPRGGVHPDLVRDHVRFRRGARLPGAPEPRAGHHRRLAGRARRLLRLVRDGPGRRQAAGAQAGPVRAGDRVRREPGRAVPGRARGLGHPGRPDAALRPRLHLDRRGPGARPRGPVRDPEPDRHGHLRRHAVLDRVRARQRLAERQPRPGRRRLHPVRALVVMCHRRASSRTALRQFRREAAPRRPRLRRAQAGPPGRSPPAPPDCRGRFPRTESYAARKARCPAELATWSRAPRFDQHRHAHHLSAGLAQRVDRGQRGGAGGGGVLHREHPRPATSGPSIRRWVP